MSRKTMIWGGLMVGSAIGGFMPQLWGSSAFSFTSVFLTALGGLAGVWLGYKLGS